MDINTYILLILVLGVGTPALHVLYSYWIGRLCKFAIATRKTDWYGTQIWVLTGVTTIIFYVGAAAQILGGYLAPMYWVYEPQVMTTGQAACLFAIMFFLPPPIIHGIAFVVTGRSRSCRREDACG